MYQPLEERSTTNVVGEVAKSESVYVQSAVAAINARSTEELQQLVDVYPYDPDVLSSVFTVLDVCDDPRLEKAMSVAAAMEYMDRKGSSSDASYLRQIRQKFCNRTLQLPYPSDEDFADTLLQTRLRTSPGLAEIEQIVDAVSESSVMSAEEHATLISIATELLASTPSFHVFHTTGTLLIEQGKFNLFLIESGWDHIVPVADAAAETAIQLAGCALFGGCAPNQLRAISQCVHGGCDPHAPASLEQRVIERTSPVHLQQAENIVEMIMWLRSRGS